MGVRPATQTDWPKWFFVLTVKTPARAHQHVVYVRGTLPHGNGMQYQPLGAQSPKDTSDGDLAQGGA